MKVCFATLLCFAFAIPAFSQVTPPNDTPSLKVGIVFFGNYTYTSSPKVEDANGKTVSPNSFDVTRAYLNFTGNVNHRIEYRITPDIARGTVIGATATLNNSLLYRIKYAYMQFDLDDWTSDWKQTWVRIGANPTPLVNWEEDVYRYRFQGTIFEERTGRLVSSDFGLSFHTSFPKDYGEIHTGVYNGEGYGNAEANSRKAIQTRVTVRPLATSPIMDARGLRFTGFYDWDHYVEKDERKRLVFQGLYEHPHLTAAVDWMDAHDQTNTTSPNIHGRGYSIWATPIFKEKSSGPELLLRWDHWMPDHSNEAAKQNTVIFGAAYWFPH